MSDFDATPIDEQASDLLDDNASTDNPAVAGRLRHFASLQAAIADVEPPAPAVRERLIAAAISAAPVSNVVPLRRRPLLAAGAGLVAAAAAASLIFVVSNRHHQTIQSSGAANTTAAAAASPVKAADSAATEAAGAFAATTTAAAAATTASPAPTSIAASLAGHSYNTPQELVAAYQAARKNASVPAASASASSMSPACVFAGEPVGSITYQNAAAELFVTTDSFGHTHLTVLAIKDCHRVIEVTVP